MKIKNQKITAELLKSKVSAKYGKAKWILFCEVLLQKGYSLYLYEANRTFSKYITIVRNGRRFKVRFSNHKPSFTKQIEEDSDFYVGVTHTGVTTTEDALKAVEEYFNKPRLKFQKKCENSTATRG